MKGSYNIKVETRTLKYDININRNITIITGDSATGKTTLIRSIDDYYNEGKESGVKVQCDKQCIVLKGKNWQRDLQYINDSIVFLDEGSKFIKSHDFADAIKNSDNYYVIITREHLDNLPYSVNEIYELRTKGKEQVSNKTYNEMNSLYGSYITTSEVKPDVLITEDDKSGFQFFENVGNKHGIKCVTAKGKSNIKNMIDSRYNNDKVVIIADGAAFGPQMEAVIKCMKQHPNYILYLPESFEWLILKSGIFRDNTLSKILANPSDYIESSEYFSWERFFTHLIAEISEQSLITKRYVKSKLDDIYKNEGNYRKILNQIKYIKFM